MRTELDRVPSRNVNRQIRILLSGLALTVALSIFQTPLLGQGDAAAETLVENIARGVSRSMQSNSRQLTPDDAVLRVSRKHVLLNLTNAYDPSGIRYLAIQLEFRNTGTADITIDTQASRLLVGKDEFPRAQTQEDFPNFSFNLIGESASDVETIQGTSPITVSTNRTAEAWLVFGNLPRTRDLPPLTLRLETSSGRVELELSRVENDSLTSQLERIGPSGRIGIARIEGELNVINASHFSKLMVGYAEQGVTRLVIALDQDFRIGDELTQEWLVHGPEDDNERLQLYPQWSRLMRSVVFTNVPGQSDAPEDWSAKDEADAIRKVTRDFIPGLAPTTLHREIRTGHPLFRRAILLNAGDAVANDDCDVVLEFLNSPDLEIKNAAIQSLRSALDPRAVPALEVIVRNGTREEASLALHSLNSSQRTDARQLAIDLAADPEVQKNIGLAQILRTIGVDCDERWSPFLRQSFQSVDSVVRECALPLLLQSGTDDRLGVLQAALADKWPAVRDLAFNAMVVRRTADEHPLFVREALRRIQSGEPEDRTLVALCEIRDPSVLPQILKWIDANPRKSQALVNAYVEIGGSAVFQDLLDRYSHFSTDTRSFLLRTLSLARHPECRRLAEEGLVGEDVDFQELCELILVDFGDAAAVTQLTEALIKSTNSSRSDSLARSLGVIGSPEALRALESLRTSSNLVARPFAEIGIQVLRSNSPVSMWIIAATTKTQVDDFEGAIQLLKCALEIDPQSSQIYNSLGFNQLSLARRDEARANFEKGLQLDPNSHNSLTGIGICLAISGRCDEAIRMVNTPLVYLKYANEQIYLYNVACVYGRCLEHLLLEPESSGKSHMTDEYRGKAIQFLNSAIEKGFDNPGLLLKDPDLKSLHDQPGFQRLADRLRGEN